MTAKYLLPIGLLFSFCLILNGQNYDPALPAGPITTLSFEQTEFNFGEINEGEIIQNVVRFTNTGDEPLVISNAKATCGCTIPEWPREPIKPGETAELLVQFDSKGKGHVEGKLNSKRVTITANTDPVNSYVTIKGKVFKQEKGAEKPKRHDSFDIDAKSINLYPNPTTDIVQLDLKQYVGKSAVIEVYNMVGERFETKKIETISEEVLQLDLSTYDNGAYTFSISIEGHNRIAKTVIVN